MPSLRNVSLANQLCAGDIGAVIGLKHARTGDTLSSSPHSAALKRVQVPPCVFGLRLEPQSNADVPALEVGLQRLLREDPSLQLLMDDASNSVTLRGMGELHLEVALHRLCKDFGCKVQSFSVILLLPETWPLLFMPARVFCKISLIFLTAGEQWFFARCV